jgi:hypothetical protein
MCSNYSRYIKVKVDKKWEDETVPETKFAQAVKFPPSLRLFVYLTGLVEEGHRGDQTV